MKKILLLLILVFVAFTAYVSKPDNKTCIIKAVEYVWGDKTPDKYKYPAYYEQFMDATSKAVEIEDRIFWKRIKYKAADQYKTVGIGLFKQVVIF
ncbi:MAG TPA: hypothetical protein VEV15_10705 [Flavisolibacter sp.]|nr:hypothetical protein [Flavisolibacter sp.]